MIGSVGYSADNRDGVAATVVGRCWCIEGPSSAKFNRFVRAAASNHRSCRIYHNHLLAARSAVAASVSRLPHASRIKGAAAMTSCIGDRADNRDTVAATVIGRRRSVEGPGGAKFDRLFR